MTVMKKKLFMMGALTAALTMATGCSNEELIVDNGGENIVQTGGTTEVMASTPQEGPGTRLVYELTAEGLKVAWAAYSQTSPERFYGKGFVNSMPYNYTQNFRFTQKEDATVNLSSCKFSIETWNVMAGGIKFWGGGTFSSGIDMHVVYPAREEHRNIFEQELTFSVDPVTLNLSLTPQTGKLDALKDFDYMTANGTITQDTQEEGTTALNLSFRHRIAILCLKDLQFEGITNNVTAFSISGTGVKPSAKLTMTKGTTSDAIAFDAIDDAAITTSGSTFAITSGTQTENAYICFFPNADMTGQTITVSATVGSDTYSCTFTAPTFAEGNMYTLSGKTMTKI